MNKQLMVLVVLMNVGMYSFAQVGFRCISVPGAAASLSVCLWYPSKSSPTEKKMRFEDYRGAIRPLSDSEASAANNFIARRAKLALDVELSSNDVRSILDAETAVIKDAEIQDGSFPLVVALQQDDPSQCSLLYEYLAGRGFVVAMSAPTDDQSKRMMADFGKPGHAQVANERANDIKKITDYLMTQPFVDGKRTVLLGINSEGIPALLFQMKYGGPKAVATIDGWESEKTAKIILLKSGDFQIRNMKSPYYEIFSDRKYLRDMDQPAPNLFDTLQYTKRYRLTLKGLNHFFYMGNMGVVPQLSLQQKIAMNYFFTSIGNFFEANMKGSSESKKFMKKTPLENGLPADLLKEFISKGSL